MGANALGGLTADCGAMMALFLGNVRWAPTGCFRVDTSVPDYRENQAIADKLRDAAALLEAQGANPFRAGAYRKAADTIARLTRSVRETFEAEGVGGVDALPNIGKGIATAIAEILITGRWNQLERLRGTLDPVMLFQSVPGIGPQLARRTGYLPQACALRIVAPSVFTASLCCGTIRADVPAPLAFTESTVTHSDALSCDILRASLPSFPSGASVRPHPCGSPAVHGYQPTG